MPDISSTSPQGSSSRVIASDAQQNAQGQPNTGGGAVGASGAPQDNQDLSNTGDSAAGTPRSPQETLFGPAKRRLNLGLQAPQGRGLSSKAHALGEAVSHLNSKLGWSRDGAMVGLKAGLALGALMGLSGLLMPGGQVFGLVMMCLAPTLGLIVGLAMQAHGRKMVQTDAQELKAQVAAYHELGGDPLHPQVLEASKLVESLETGSWQTDMQGVQKRMLGSLGHAYGELMGKLQVQAEQAKMARQAQKEAQQEAAAEENV